MNKSLYIELPEELYEKLRKFCFVKDLSKKEVVNTALSDFLKTKEPREKPSTPQQPVHVSKVIENKANPYKVRDENGETLVERLRREANEKLKAKGIV